MTTQHDPTPKNDEPPIRFDIWGCRGSRSLARGASGVGVRTSCYSLLLGDEIIIIDAGRGLTALSQELLSSARFQGVKRVEVLLSHAHMDHWEGLKDAEWFWQPGNDLEVRLRGTGEALDAVRRGFDPPSFVALDVLAIGTVRSIAYLPLTAGDGWTTPRYRVETFALNHFSGLADSTQHLDTVGFRIRVTDGPTIAYLCDHQPNPDTEAMELAATDGAHLILIDAHFTDRADQAYGHGSQEHAAWLAAQRPAAFVLATHHGASASDDQILTGFERHRADLSNFELAREGHSFVWDRRNQRLGKG